MNRPVNFFTILLFSLILSVGNATAAEKDQIDKIRYGGEYYDNYRKITYWGKAVLVIRDYHYKGEDAEYLRLIVKDETYKIGKYIPDRPREDIKQHFMGEFKRLFVDHFNLPFHDNDIGYKERWGKFHSEQGEQVWSPEFIDKWNALEVARRRSLYGGHPGSIYCYIQVKRINFPVLYEIECSVSAEEDLGSSRRVQKKDIGFSSPEHIGGELKNAITEMLKEQSIEMAKIRKHER